MPSNCITICAKRGRVGMFSWTPIDYWPGPRLLRMIDGLLFRREFYNCGGSRSVGHRVVAALFSILPRYKDQSKVKWCLKRKSVVLTLFVPLDEPCIPSVFKTNGSPAMAINQ
jgi:hypothetical protein